MEYHELKNYGNFFSGKAPPQEIMKTIAKVPAHLGILGTPKFMANMQRTDRHWKRKRFTSIEERGTKNQEFIEVVRDSLGFAAAYHEAGHPEVGSLGGQVESAFLGRLAKRLGGEFRRESCLCHGDATCDWHLLRNGTATPG